MFTLLMSVFIKSYSHCSVLGSSCYDGHVTVHLLHGSLLNLITRETLR